MVQIKYALMWVITFIVAVGMALPLLAPGAILVCIDLHARGAHYPVWQTVFYTVLYAVSIVAVGTFIEETSRRQGYLTGP